MIYHSALHFFSFRIMFIMILLPIAWLVRRYLVCLSMSKLSLSCGHWQRSLVQRSKMYVWLIHPVWMRVSGCFRLSCLAFSFIVQRVTHLQVETGKSGIVGRCSGVAVSMVSASKFLSSLLFSVAWIPPFTRKRVGHSQKMTQNL